MDSGCNFVTGHTKKWNKKTRVFDNVNVFCHKLTAKDSPVCPLHDLIQKDQLKEAERKEERRLLNRHHKALKEETLAASPLAGVNGEFKQKKPANWMQGYDR